MQYARVLLMALASASAHLPIGTATAQEKLSKAQREALALTPAHFEQTATYKNDSLDTVAEVNTYHGFQHKEGLLKVVNNDNFLRGHIDKATGETKIQVYQFISYTGDWRFYYGANYETPTGPKAVDVTVIDRKVLSCSRYLGCSHVEHFAFDVDETLLREIAARYQPGEAAGWRFKYRSKAGEDWQDGMLGAEVVGFLSALDRQRRLLGIDGR